MYGMYLMMASPRMACRPVLACEEEIYTDSMRTDLFTIGDEPVKGNELQLIVNEKMRMRLK